MSVPPYTPEPIADWEERYRLLFERHELFVLKLCQELGLPYEISGENDVLEKLQTEKKLTQGLLKGLSE